MTQPQIEADGPATSAAAGLDWRDASHWSTALLRCVHCQGLTNLRDVDRRPSHKTCAETLTVAAVEVDASRAGAAA